MIVPGVRRAAVLGLGLMGGSLARDLAAAGVEVLGHDRDPEAVRAARAAGAVRAGLGPGLEGAETADLLVVAVPVSAAEAALAAALPRLRPDCVLTDLGSTKRSIGEAAARLGVADRFVGSHPLTGDHRSGWDASRPDLYAGATVYLCPTPATRPDALERVHGLWVALGARPEVVDAAEHDQRLAWSSHLPQVASTALAEALAAAGVGPAALGPGGRDATRLAASSPELWSAICLDNAACIEPAVAALEEVLADLRRALREGDAVALQRHFAASRAWARAEAGSA